MAQKITLRPYQERAISRLRDRMRAGQRRVVLYSPTGSGKTEMAIELIRSAEAKGKRVLFVANRIQLVGQASRRLLKSGIRHGVVQGQNSFWTTSQILVCSIQTLHSRGFPEAVDFLVIDEAHGAAGSEAYRSLIMESKVPVIGLSATPFSRGLGKHYDDLGGPLFESIVEAATIRELIELGFLVDCDIYAPSEPDLKGVKITAGDYNEKQLGERVDKEKLIGDIVEHWKRLANDTQTVCFATNIAHSQHICEEFNRSGVRAEHIDCYTSDEDRQSILRRLENGDTRIVCNVGVLAEGWDCPLVETMILARPTRSLVRYIQMAGRVLRPHPGKTRALILDHSGTAVRLGFPTDDLPLELDDGRPKEAKDSQEREERLQKPCPQCHFVPPHPVHVCPQCGHENKRQSDVKVGDGQLKKLARSKATMQDKQAVWSQLYGYGVEKGYNRHWADHAYREYFGCWPRGMQDRAAPLTQEVKNFIAYKNIKHAKRAA